MLLYFFPPHITCLINVIIKGVLPWHPCGEEHWKHCPGETWKGSSQSSMVLWAYQSANPLWRLLWVPLLLVASERKWSDDPRGHWYVQTHFFHYPVFNKAVLFLLLFKFQLWLSHVLNAVLSMCYVCAIYFLTCSFSSTASGWHQIFSRAKKRWTGIKTENIQVWWKRLFLFLPRHSSVCLAHKY